MSNVDSEQVTQGDADMALAWATIRKSNYPIWPAEAPALIAELIAEVRQSPAASTAREAELREALREVIGIAKSHGAMNYVGSARRIEAARALLTRHRSNTGEG